MDTSCQLRGMVTRSSSSRHREGRVDVVGGVVSGRLGKACGVRVAVQVIAAESAVGISEPRLKLGFRVANLLLKPREKPSGKAALDRVEVPGVVIDCVCDVLTSAEEQGLGWCPRRARGRG